MKPRPYQPPESLRDLTCVPTHRVHLANLPTPWQTWDAPDLPADVDLSIARDDMTGAVLSGNKVRKLEFLLADALQQGCDTVLTCGGIQSNHARATAVAAARLGLESHLFLRTDRPDEHPGHAGNLLFDQLVGAHLHLITSEQYQDRTNVMKAHASDLRSHGRSPYVIPEGGSNALGCWGYIEAVQEWMTHHDLNRVTDIVVALGSGGTVAGIAAGLHLFGLTPKLHAVNVCDDAAYFHERVQGMFDELGLALKSQDVIDIMGGYVGLGYALSRPEELTMLHSVATTTGIVLDPVYAGKAWFGLCEELKENRIRFAGGHVLFVHTGGLFGLYPMADRLLNEDPGA